MAMPAPQTSHLDSHIDAFVPEGEFEVILLKYADVSGIVGLLTSSQTTKPWSGLSLAAHAQAGESESFLNH